MRSRGLSNTHTHIYIQRIYVEYAKINHIIHMCYL